MLLWSSYPVLRAKILREDHSSLDLVSPTKLARMSLYQKGSDVEVKQFPGLDLRNQSVANSGIKTSILLLRWVSLKDPFPICVTSILRQYVETTFCRCDVCKHEALEDPYWL